MSEFITSFFYVDWENIWSKYSKDGRSIRIGRVSSDEELISFCIDKTVLGLQSAYIYKTVDKSSNIDKYSEGLFSSKLANVLHYQGYTNDEYNMIHCTALNLSQGSLVFQKPLASSKLRYSLW